MAFKRSQLILRFPCTFTSVAPHSPIHWQWRLPYKVATYQSEAIRGCSRTLQHNKGGSADRTRDHSVTGMLHHQITVKVNVCVMCSHIYLDHNKTYVTVTQLPSLHYFKSQNNTERVVFKSFSLSSAL